MSLNHLSEVVFIANRDAIERQVSTILAARGTELGKRTVLCAVFRRASGKRLADVVRTTYGPVVVTYLNTDDRVTGDVRAIAPLTAEDDQQFPVDAPDPASMLSAAELRAAIKNGRHQIVHYADSADIARQMAYGTAPEARPLTKAVALRNRLRKMLAYNQTHGGLGFAVTEQELLRAEADCERLLAADEKRRARRNPPKRT